MLDEDGPQTRKRKGSDRAVLLPIVMEVLIELLLLIGGVTGRGALLPNSLMHTCPMPFLEAGSRPGVGQDCLKTYPQERRPKAGLFLPPGRSRSVPGASQGGLVLDRASRSRLLRKPGAGRPASMPSTDASQLERTRRI